jgi:hypothetical protein
MCSKNENSTSERYSFPKMLNLKSSFRANKSQNCSLLIFTFFGNILSHTDVSIS